MVLLKELFEKAKKDYGYSNLKRRKNKKHFNKETGFYGVTKKKCRGCVQGFTWAYETKNIDNTNIYMSNVDFLTLKKRVKRNNLHWGIIDYSKAEKTSKILGLKLEDLL